MKKISFYAMMTLLVSVCTSVSAQEYDGLGPSVSQQMADAVRQQVNQFTDCLSFIVDKNQKPQNRYAFKEDALKLFIGRGLEYFDNVLDEKGNVLRKKKHAPVTMEVTSLRNPRPKKHYMTSYLTNLINLANNKTYRTVSLTTTKWHDMKVSRFWKTGEDQYVCDVYFEQVYESRGPENKLIYTDKTTKRVTVYIKVVHTDFGDEFIILLGDITAEETQPNRQH